ncbi:MAG: TlpA family protein disulfide reductase [Bdellovibrionaceae bacterium]|nr:TlpA family protein disulfide reductase [Pseudobdellovibrionaceae bacterium]
MRNLFLISTALVIGTAAVVAVLKFQDPRSVENFSLDLIKSADSILENKISKEPQVIIVNFWASWCPPCIAETPSMLKFAKAHSEKLQLILVSEDSSSKEIRDFVKLFNDIYAVNMRVIWDASRKLGQNFKVYKMPETFVFNRSGKLLMQLSGSVDWSEPELQKKITEHFQN